MKFILVVSIALLSSSFRAQVISRDAWNDMGKKVHEATSNETPLAFFDPLFAPAPPAITTESSRLEVCAGGTTTLSASSEHEIYWFLTPPPLGKPIGKGPTYVTPELSQGYYVYYAIAHNDRSYSNFTSIDIVMVYPLPAITVSSSHELLCTGETATISARGSSKLIWESGETNSSIYVSPTTNSTYKVTGINTAGCVSTTLFTQKVENCLSLEEKHRNSAEELKVYPNPNHGEFNINLSSLSGLTQGEIYNSLGELIYSCTIENTNTTVKLEGLPSGVYVLKILENGKNTHQQRIIKE